MKRLISAMFVATIFSSNCFAAEAKTIETRLYSAAIPSVSVAGGGQWNRFARVGASDDLVISQGSSGELYSATIRVKRNSGIKGLPDLQASTGLNGVAFAKVDFTKKSQANLLCVQPAMTGNVRPFPDGSIFTKIMACIDTNTDIYYELSVSWKVLDPNKVHNRPADGLSVAANEFFAGFSTK